MKKKFDYFFYVGLVCFIIAMVSLYFRDTKGNMIYLIFALSGSILTGISQWKQLNSKKKKKDV